MANTEGIRMKILAILSGSLLALVATVAFAASLSANWTNPTQFDDGSPLNPATDIERIDFYCNGDDTTPLFTSLGGASSIVVDLPPGVYDCYGIVVATTGTQSVPSESRTFTVIAPRPFPIEWGSGSGVIGPGGSTND